MTDKQTIATLGAGRMGRGIAVAFAYSGHKVHLIDVKDRPEAQARQLAREALADIRASLAMMAGFGLLEETEVDPMLSRVTVHARADMGPALAGVPVIFEGVPEVLDIKQQCFAEASRFADPDAIIASTTRTRT